MSCNSTSHQNIQQTTQNFDDMVTNYFLCLAQPFFKIDQPTRISTLNILFLSKSALLLRLTIEKLLIIIHMFFVKEVSYLQIRNVYNIIYC